MTGRAACIAGGAAIAATVTGAAHALASASPIVVAGSGMAAIGLAALDEHRKIGRRGFAATLAWSIGGAVLGLLLPTTAPPAAGAVVARAARLDLRGDIFDVLDLLDRDPGSVVGRAVTVTGSWTPARGGDAATVSRRVMSCCAADAVDVGFDVVTVGGSALPTGAHVRVRGVVASHLRDGELRYVLERSTVTTLEDP